MQPDRITEPEVADIKSALLAALRATPMGRELSSTPDELARSMVAAFARLDAAAGAATPAPMLTERPSLEIDCVSLAATVQRLLRAPESIREQAAEFIGTFGLTAAEGDERHSVGGLEVVKVRARERLRNLARHGRP